MTDLRRMMTAARRAEEIGDFAEAYAIYRRVTAMAKARMPSSVKRRGGVE